MPGVLSQISSSSQKALVEAKHTFLMLCTNARKGTITKKTLQRIKDKRDKVAQLSFAVKEKMNWDVLIQKLNDLCKHAQDILQLYLHLNLHVKGEKLI